jgi:hypothetical protein
MSGADGINSSANAIYLQSLQPTTSITQSLFGDNDAGSITATPSAGVSTSISPMGQLLSNLQELQAQDPTKFQQVVGQIANQLQTAAQQQGATGTGNFLTQLSAKFQSVADGGDLSQLQPHHHGHHGHHTYDSNGQAVNSASATNNASSVQQLFANIASEVSQALET